MRTIPSPQGLYDARHEHDACGVAFVATLTGEASHAIVAQALTALRNLDHRGASGAEAESGDGAGILLQIPDRFLRAVTEFDLPVPGAYAVGTAFLADDAELADKARAEIETLAGEERLRVLGWREVPVRPELLGATSRASMPTFAQLFVAASGAPLMGIALDRRVYCLRKRIEHEVGVYFPSLSSRT
ncbi:MAG TPA: glutamate synthase subunit alpha, partial [Nocardioidaceae bacterium]|nr:glutamate synthase subunit alpha [Nocardioidaceae bacterium]